MAYPGDAQLDELLRLFLEAAGPAAEGWDRAVVRRALRSAVHHAHAQGMQDADARQAAEWQAVAEQMQAIQRVQQNTAAQSGQLPSDF